MLAGEWAPKITKPMVCGMVLLSVEQETTSSQGQKVMCPTNQLFILMAAMLTIQIGQLENHILEHGTRKSPWDVRRFCQQLGSLNSR